MKINKEFIKRLNEKNEVPFHLLFIQKTEYLKVDGKVFIDNEKMKIVAYFFNKFYQEY